MSGYKDFNFPAFHKAAAELRAMGHEVFSPAEKDIEKYGTAAFKGGVETQHEVAINAGFSLRAALQMDLDYICTEADGIALMHGWLESKGTAAESATAVALGLRRFIQIFPDGNDNDEWIEVDRHGHTVPSRLPDCRYAS